MASIWVSVVNQGLSRVIDKMRANKLKIQSRHTNGYTSASVQLSGTLSVLKHFAVGTLDPLLSLDFHKEVVMCNEIPEKIFKI